MMKVISISTAMFDRRPDREPQDRHSIRTNTGNIGSGKTWAEALAAAIAKDMKEDAQQTGQRRPVA